MRTPALALAAILFAGLPAHAAPGDSRSLHYRPEGTDFVVENGSHRFNRPLYAGNTGFRAEAGDKPEFAFFLPGRGGNLRLGLIPADAATPPRWLHSARSVTARYRPGSMVYQIVDPLLGTAGLTVTAIPAAGAEAVLFRIETRGRHPALSLAWAYGGGDGDPGRRNGDLNAENEPLDRYFTFRPEQAKNHRFQLQPTGFSLPMRNGTLLGLLPSGARATLADAARWNGSPRDLLASATDAPAAPVAAGEVPLVSGKPVILGLHLVRPKQMPVLSAADLPRAFEAAETFRLSLTRRLEVDTPDPFLNAAAAAIPVAADAIWDASQAAYMHGAIGWRIRLLGWRAAYAGDALGWPDRTRSHLSWFAKRQDTSPAPASIPPADEKFNLARNETALISRGDFAVTNPRHYDMNLVAIDTLFRHLLWTGDLAFAREMWPVIELQIERERRLFRRPFGPDGLPLYEAYACIWASDELIYNGGGATHATAYNYWHNHMAARLAEKLGKDPSAYRKEADAIRRAMHRELWLPQNGWFAEYRDWLGKRSAHTSPAVWTFYHTLDSEAASPFEAWQASRFIETGLARIPLHGKGVPAGNFALPTTNWMPYQWSINNVALAESAHTALALWQGGRGDFAMPVIKGALLDAMFMGPCPGNVGMTSQSDRFSGERYRDFADAVGITARAFVEGLFGVRPDLLEGKLDVSPGFPADWDHASLRHENVSLAFKREGLEESYAIESRLAKPVRLRLEIPALRDRVGSVTVNGKPVRWKNSDAAIGTPRIVIDAAPAPRNVVVVTWQGEVPEAPQVSALYPLGEKLAVGLARAKALAIEDPQGILQQGKLTENRIDATAGGTPGHRSAFVRLAQGDLAWWRPLAMELRPALEIEVPAAQDPDSLRFILRNNSASPVKGPVSVSVGGTTHQLPAEVPAKDRSAVLSLPAAGLAPGTHPLVVRFPDGREVAREVTNWKLKPAAARWETVDLTNHFNDRVTRIFRNEYRSPRSPFCSLALPKQGTGGWCYYQATAEIDDAGLRATAGQNDGIYPSALGIPFRTPGPGEAKNILFTTLWDNYPDEATVPLAGKAARAVLLMAGSTYAMQCRFDNGEVVATYQDGSNSRLMLHSPVNWWPIDQDYHVDRFAFARPEPVPPRLDLKTGTLRVMTPDDCRSRGSRIPGGAATVLDLPLDPAKELRSLTVRTLGNEVVIGLMALTLERPDGWNPGSLDRQ